MRKIRVLFASLFIFSATQAMAIDLCDMSKIATDVASTSIALGLSCNNAPAIAEDLQDLLGNLGLCSAERIDLSMMCPFVTSFVVNEITNQIPANWQCDPKVAKSIATQLVSKGCEIISGSIGF